MIFNDDLVSIIIPVYNVQNYLQICIESVVKQTYQNIEIILVDDGSTDNSGKLCDQFQKMDARIKVIHQQNSGSTAARNAGLRMAIGKYVGFVDSDDWIEEDMYEVLYRAIKSSNAEIAVARQYIDRGEIEYPERLRSIYQGTYQKFDNTVVHNIIYSDDYKNKGISPNLWDKLFEKNLLENFQLKVDVGTKFAEDDLAVYSCLLEADVVTFVNKPVYHYRQRPGSVTKKADEEYFSKISLFYKQMKAVFLENEQSELLMEKLNRYMLELVLRGINDSFGFGYGNVIPYYRPNSKLFVDLNIKQIVLYGAGNVGRDYYSYFKQCGIIEVVLWVDKNAAIYSKEGYNVLLPDYISSLDGKYDAVLIAVDNDQVADNIKEELLQSYQIENDKLLYSTPIKFIEVMEKRYV